MYSALGLKRLSEFISACGGLHNAAMKLKVSPSTLGKILQGKVLSKPTRQKIEAAFGTITEPAPPTMRPKGGTRETGATSSFIGHLTSFIHGCSSLEGASSRLGVRPSTLKRLLVGRPVSFHPRQRIKRILNGTAPCKPDRK